MGSRPVARGSRVPPWPALAASKKRRTAATAEVEVIPACLSRMSQPSTFWPRRLRAIVAVFLQIANHGGILQQTFDAPDIVEGEIGGKSDRRRHPQFDRAGKPRAEESAGAIQGLGECGGIAAPEGHHEG